MFVKVFGSFWMFLDVFAGLFMLTSLLLAIFESRSVNENSFIDEEVINDIDVPLIKIEEEMDSPVPPKSE